MIILLFGISNVGKSTVGKIVADTLKIPFYDLDDEIKKLYNMDEYNNYLKQFNLPNIFIDNQKLDGFLEKFVKKYDCDKKICTAIIKNDIYEKDYSKSYTCDYCKVWGDKVITFNQEERTQWLQNNVKFNDNLKKSLIFKK